ncbi:Threonine/homoserine/homoserine lactone efflux protein [Pseudarcicella hirudinis]|uniref:Threonine/homoserine/homoserine lactone efflux protein n=2 Tax=Pseudarcicella hirudinis TaxID=1079859 RepID=A0A1I5X1S0_9BACT|nr:LysE family transporter [Pseudarcicella hirudinis]SFQ25955.1 Threonine/homoserine/homoserine lactone efflux protein [Pseudarcicella hirudinis]
MKIIAVFLVTTIISFLGSIHPGPLNMCVIQSTLQRNLKTGILITIGGVLPEIIYGWLALRGVDFFEKNEVVFNYLQWLIVPVLLVMGLSALVKKNGKSTDFNQKDEAVSVLKGFSLSMLNPQLLPFWVLVLLGYSNYEHLHITDWTHELSFVLAASMGACLLNLAYALYADLKRDFVFKYLNYRSFDRVIGLAFIVMAFFQLLKNLEFF